MGTELTLKQMVKLARILMQDNLIGCAALSALTEAYTGTEMLELFQRYLAEADPDQAYSDTALDFVAEITGGGQG